LIKGLIKEGQELIKENKCHTMGLFCPPWAACAFPRLLCTRQIKKRGIGSNPCAGAARFAWVG